MDLTSRGQLHDLLYRHDIRLAKTYGQHFLVDRKALDRIVAAAFPEAALRPALVVEVGPGAGSLTVELAKRAERVVAIERDERFIPVLKETLAGFDNVEVVRDDAMKVIFSDLVGPSPLGGRGKERGSSASPSPDPSHRGRGIGLPTSDSPRYAVVSNLPYEISTPFLWKLLYDEPVRPAAITLLLQEEVVDRALAKAPKMNLLSLLVALSGEAEKSAKVGRQSFEPAPRVDSAVLRIEGIAPGISDAERAAISIAKRAFAAPRKKLSNTIGAQAGRFGDKRPEALKASDWMELVAR